MELGRYIGPKHQKWKKKYDRIYNMDLFIFSVLYSHPNLAHFFCLLSAHAEKCSVARHCDVIKFQNTYTFSKKKTVKIGIE